MKKECPIEYCHAPATSCNEGHDKPNACPHYKEYAAKESEKGVVDESYNFPWTGNSLGLENINLITTFSKPSLIGLIGPFSSGKTTILATSYLVLFNGFDLGNYNFAGSLTLDGWEKISSYLKFRGYNQPTFPPHTPLGQNRIPGLLHLCLRENNGNLNDIVITDPPGEWFEKWADNVNDDGAEGARWIANNSSHFMFIIDSETLIGKTAQKAKYNLIDLAQRLASVCGERPVAIVWSKSDYEIDANLKASLMKQLDKLFAIKEYFELSVTKGDRESLIKSFQSLWSWLFQVQKKQRLSLSLPRTANDYFLDYRG
jgi:hypothetical protein